MQSKSSCLSLLAFICFAVITFYSKPAIACSCMPSHPQTLYCEADYAVVIRVLRKSYRPFDNNTLYKIQIKKSYKTTPEGDMILKHRRLITPSNDAMCGVKLTIGKLYVVVGRSSNLNMCSYIREYQKMTVVERMGFARLYRKSCGKCNIKTCFQRFCSKKDKDRSVCLWSPFDACKKDFSACLPYTSYHGISYYKQQQQQQQQDDFSKYHREVRCKWRSSPVYNKCISEPEL